MSIFRTLLLLGIGIAFIPVDPAIEARQDLPQNTGMIQAATSFVADMSGLCERQPDFCTYTSATASIMSAKALSGVNWVKGHLDGYVGSRLDQGQDTLTYADKVPAWRNPA